MTPKDVDDRAELVVRRYFDRYLENTFPEQMRQVVAAHNSNRKAHGSAESKVNRLFYGIAAVVALVGFIAALKAIYG